MPPTIPAELVVLGVLLVVLVVAALTTFYLDYKATMLDRHAPLAGEDRHRAPPRRSTEPDED